MIEEADRSLHDALSVLSQTVKETRVVLGGGCAEMAMAVAVDEEAKHTEGKKALAVEAFARALRQVSLCSGVRSAVPPFAARADADSSGVRCAFPQRFRLSWRTMPGTTRPIWSPSCVRHITRAGRTRVSVRFLPPPPFLFPSSNGLVL